MTDIIVAIDLGTSHFAGVVGERFADGAFSVISVASVGSSDCMRRGNIHNVELAAAAVRRLVAELERSLPVEGSKIENLYVGVGGYSLHSVEQSFIKNIENERLVTNDDLSDLSEQIKQFKPKPPIEILDYASPSYYCDGRKENKPDGVRCSTLEAKYKLITGRSSLRRDILQTVCDRCGLSIAGLVIAPVALGDALFGHDEKMRGCALVDFGDGVTNVTVYADGDFIGTSVVPFGASLITNDITLLNVSLEQAEKLKRTHGSAIVNSEDKTVLKVENETDTIDIDAHSLNSIIEGRCNEIVANVAAQIKELSKGRPLGAGIFVAGGGAELPRLTELVTDKTGLKTRPAVLRNSLFKDFHDTGNPDYITALAILLKGKEPCVYIPEPLIEEPLFKPPVESVPDAPQKKSLFSRIRKKRPTTDHKPKPQPIPTETPVITQQPDSGKEWGDLFVQTY